MSAVTVKEILFEKLDDRCWLGGALDAPQVNACFEAQSLRIAGWALCRSAPLRCLRVMHQDRLLRRIFPDLKRPDVASHVGASEQSVCGFDAKVGLIGLPEQATLEVELVPEGQAPTLLARITVQREPLRPVGPVARAPLCLTALGRSGTTFLMQCFARHPELLLQQTYPFEFRFGGYWMHNLAVLTAPSDFKDGLHPDVFPNQMSRTGANPFYENAGLPLDALNQLLGTAYVSELAAWSARAIDRVYEQIAHDQQATSTRYFVEKCQPNHIPCLFRELYPDSKEIFLVRDFRDVLCSMLAFIEKRGEPAFGRQRFSSPEAFLRKGLAKNANALLTAWRERSHKSVLLRYEDVMARPGPELRTAFQALDLASDDDTLRRVLGEGMDDHPAMAGHKTGSGASGRWKTALSSELKDACQSCLGEALKAFGYE